jgi:hypothetical protein
MFSHKTYIQRFLDSPGLNDAAEKCGVRIQSVTGALFRCIGVHHLEPRENQGNHHVYLAVVDEAGQRVADAVIGWTWEGRRQEEEAPAVLLDKPDYEPWGNIPLGAGQIATVWVSDDGGSDLVSGLTTAPNIPDQDGNTRFHHSYFVAFQRRDSSLPPVPTPEPPPVEPPVEPPPAPGPGLDPGEVRAMAEYALRAADSIREVLVQLIIKTQ